MCPCTHFFTVTSLLDLRGWRDARTEAKKQVVTAQYLTTHVCGSDCAATQGRTLICMCCVIDDCPPLIVYIRVRPTPRVQRRLFVWKKSSRSPLHVETKLNAAPPPPPPPPPLPPPNHVATKYKNTSNNSITTATLYCKIYQLLG